MQAPDVQRSRAHPHNAATASRMSRERRMPQEPAHETGSLVLAHGQVDEAVGSVTEVPLVEAVIAGEKGGPWQRV